MKSKKTAKPKSGKVKTSFVTYTWKPPTKEEEASKKEAERRNRIRELKEIGIYLEGMKKASPVGLYPLGHSHLTSLWAIINELK